MTTISAKIIADSAAVGCPRLTTLELTYPRFIHCFDDKTEILAKSETSEPYFCSFEEVFSLGLQVAQYSETGEISFVYPSSHVKNTGSFEAVKFESDKLSMLVTSGHRVFSLRRTTNNVFLPHVEEAKNLLGEYAAHRIPKAGQYVSEAPNVDEARLVMWFCADGTIPTNQQNKIMFHFKKQRKTDEVCGILDRLGIAFEHKKYQDSSVIVASSPWWADKCYTEEGQKCLPPFMFFGNKEVYLAVKEAAFLSDGNLENQDYNSSSKQLIENLQVLATLNNDCFHINDPYSHGMYKVKFRDSNYASFRSDKDIFEKTTIEGTVYCVSVPSSYVVVRRNGKPFVSGNCEFMTHRVFSRNASSSRAIPVERQIKMIEENPAVPLYWGKNQKGMQATEDCNELVWITLSDNFSQVSREDAWLEAKDNAVLLAKQFNESGYHKQIVNRLLEPFAHITVVVTATDWDNFLELRLHKDAEPHMQHLAREIEKAFIESVPKKLLPGEWHLPYVRQEDWDQYPQDLVYGGDGYSWEEAQEALIKVSVARCARTSYLNHDGTKTTHASDIELHDKLVVSRPIHASPAEHQATPQAGTASRWSGNLRGWKQYRKMIENG